ncbi:Hyaluronan-binding protein 2 [Desmophyllum pertusum]|uniref:Hyaluronan-binding protein 2 n=1 Tax=Desmophyllum pertusum TaxID=174260 RepID=A0A9W9Z3S7_9CNID|nr:Hyaluronan-binding protein 2 [Desmophyllum pertusum]
MGIMVRVLQVVFLVSHLTLLITVYSDVNCQNFKFVIDEDVVYNHILEGHVFRRLTVYSAAQCHVTCKDDCLCVSMNYFPVSQENNCELNDVDKAMESAAMKWNPGVNYYDLVRSYTVKGGGKYIPGKHRCINRCCNPNPCVNGGVCQEICDPYSMRFTCACPDTYTGQRCEKIKYPRNCQDIAKNGAPGSGMYPIFNSTNEAFSVYCDMKSEPGFVLGIDPIVFFC